MILVTGTGWNGSTVFIKFLRGLGFTITPQGAKNTHQAYELMKDKDLVKKMAEGELPWPDAVKHLGGICFHLNEYVEKYNWDVKHVFVLVRPINDAVAKRKEKGGMNRKALIPPLSDFEYKKLTPDRLDELTRNTILATVGSAIHQIVEGGHPYSLVHYPRFTQDADYCFECIKPIFDDRERFQAVWEAIMDPFFVNKYEKNDDDTQSD